MILGTSKYNERNSYHVPVPYNAAIQDFDFYDFTKVAIVTSMSTAGVLEPVFLILS